MPEQSYRPLDSVAMTRATSHAMTRAADQVDRVMRYRSDSEREERVRDHSCRTCWYFLRPAIAGQAMTRWSCGVCATASFWGNTHAPRVCVSCSAEHSLCRWCGGDILTNPRRRKWPTPAPHPPQEPANAHV